MITAALACLALSVLFASAAPWLAPRMPPAAGVRLVVVSAIAIAVAGVYVAGGVALPWVAQRESVAQLGDWSATTLHADDPIPSIIAMCCAALLGASVVSFAAYVARRLRALLSVRAVMASTGVPGQVVVVDDPRADAFAVPGRRGRVVVTSGLLNALTPAERVALIAHERSHLRHRHTVWLLAIHGAAALNPLLRRTCRAIDHAVERWADEDAAREVGDRRLVARTLARASLLKKYGSITAVDLAMSATGGDLPARVNALLTPRSTRGRVAATILVLFVVGAAVCAIAMQRSADALLDAAQLS